MNLYNYERFHGMEEQFDANLTYEISCVDLSNAKALGIIQPDHPCDLCLSRFNFRFSSMLQYNADILLRIWLLVVVDFRVPAVQRQSLFLIDYDQATATASSVRHLPFHRIIGS